ncbi:hypothetical protein [Thermus altitudinis]|uniref:hypothetical protein n=1 Tax=Thermus altitudinis TaxID=2908145 RepID=UPI001FAAA1B9|nr:hypothetical protein [Thermus altitudinis]
MHLPGGPEPAHGEKGALRGLPPERQGAQGALPPLVKHFPAWYEALAKAWKGGDPEPCPFPEGGYDWDLVAEYRHALWAALASSPHGGKP